MRKYILLAAVAAIMTPAGALAQQHNQARHATAQERSDRRTVRANRQTMRSDHRTDRANRQTMRSDHRMIRANRRAVRNDRSVARSDRRNAGTRTRSAYVAPYHNWSYRPVTVGYRLQPSFYGSRYYIGDYGAYHLQAPHNRWLRWIRYGNDLLLVNIRNGRVLQVIHYQGW